MIARHCDPCNDRVCHVQVGGANANDREAVATPPSGDILNFTIESRRDGSFSGMLLEFGTLRPIAALCVPLEMVRDIKDTVAGQRPTLVVQSDLSSSL